MNCGGRFKVDIFFYLLGVNDIDLKEFIYRKFNLFRLFCCRCFKRVRIERWNKIFIDILVFGFRFFLRFSCFIVFAFYEILNIFKINDFCFV